MKFGEYFRLSRMMGLGARAEATVLGLHLVATALEGVGIGMLLPIVQFIQKGGDLSSLTADSLLWAKLVELYGVLGVPINLATLIVASFSAIILRQIVFYVRQVYLVTLREELNQKARNLSFKRFLGADAAYHDRESVGAVVNSMTTELRYAVDAIIAPVQILSYLILTIFYTLLLLLLAGPVTMAALAVIGVTMFVLRRFVGAAFQTGTEIADANRDLSSFLVERLGSQRLVRLSGTEDAEMEHMRGRNRRLRDFMVRMRLHIAKVEVLVEPITIAVGFVALYFGVTFLDLRLEEFGIFMLIALLRLLPAIKEILRTGQTTLGYMSSLYKFTRRVGNMVAAAEHRGGDTRFEGLKDSIRFDDVHFAYETAIDKPALKGVDLEIKAGEMTAIVGPSGAGKSTLIDLLPRLREATSGAVTIDGRPLADFSIESLRAGIGYASQFALMFNVSAAEHIRYGNPNASDDDVREAAELADAARFIEALPEGYDTLLGEDGIRLSGGQRQRLDLARTLVRKAPILILDEPTSNLDAEVEAKFRATLKRIRKTMGVTIIVVAHRLSTIALADKIVVLKDGRVVSQGSHAELLAGGGWYADAYRLQRVHAPADEETIAPHPAVAS